MEPPDNHKITPITNNYRHFCGKIDISSSSIWPFFQILLNVVKPFVIKQEKTGSELLLVVGNKYSIFKSFACQLNMVRENNI